MVGIISRGSLDADDDLDAGVWDYGFACSVLAIFEMDDSELFEEMYIVMDLSRFTVGTVDPIVSCVDFSIGLFVLIVVYTRVFAFGDSTYSRLT